MSAHHRSAAVLGLTLVIGTAIALTLFGERASSAAAHVATQLASDQGDSKDPVERDRHFRESMGLRADREYISARRADMAAGRMSKVNMELGVPLTPDEKAEIDLRQRIITRSGPKIEAYFSARPKAEFGGMLMDNRAGGMLTALTTREPSVALGALKAVTSEDSGRLVVRRVSLSLSVLEATKSAVWRDREVLHEDGVEVVGTGVDVRENKVVVNVARDPEQAVAKLEERYGADRFLVEEVSANFAASRAQEPLPFKGGTQIITFQRSDGKGTACLSGFNAYRDDNGTRKYYLITAGHCTLVGKDKEWLQGSDFFTSHYVGPATATDAGREGIADAARVYIDTASRRSNKILVTPADIRTMLISQKVGADVVGELVCLSVAVDRTLDCGELLKKSYDYGGKDTFGRTSTFPYGREVDADCDFGDSGGPAFNGVTAKGIISQNVTRLRGNDTCIYGHIFDALRTLNLKAITS